MHHRLPAPHPSLPIFFVKMGRVPACGDARQAGRGISEVGGPCQASTLRPGVRHGVGWQDSLVSSCLALTGRRPGQVTQETTEVVTTTRIAQPSARRTHSVSSNESLLYLLHGTMVNKKFSPFLSILNLREISRLFPMFIPELHLSVGNLIGTFFMSVIVQSR